MRNILKFFDDETQKSKKYPRSVDISAGNILRFDVDSMPPNSIRLSVFMFMYWLRIPVVIISAFISLPLLMFWLSVCLAFPDKTVAIWSLGFVCLSVLACALFYDFALMKISPESMKKIL